MLGPLLDPVVVSAAISATPRRATQDAISDRGLVKTSPILTLIHLPFESPELLLVLVMIRKNATRDLLDRVFIVSLHFL